nr:amylo-alpha-1,6-glucosidase [Chloroflexota bacterium]
TRVLSTSILRLNGAQLTLLRGPHRDGGIETIQLTNPEYRGNPVDRRGGAGDLARRELSVTRSRQINGALLEQVTFESYSATDEVLVIELGFGVDMADIFEVRGYPRSARGTLCPIELHDDRIEFGYDGLDGRTRTTTIRLDGARLDSLTDPLVWPGATVGATWHVDLSPGRRVTIGWTVSFAIDDPRRADGPGTARPTLASPLTPEPAPAAPVIRTDHEFLDRTLARSASDLAALRNNGPAPGESYVAAGIPWFATLFGRDSLIAGLETVAFAPSSAVATLDVLARLQATTDDPWHDAEPGKILHEMRSGEMALAGETPHDAYYGSIDSTLLWLMLLGEVHAWTADDVMLERLWPNALAALGWLETSGDLDGDGFVEYRRRSERGLLNQGWKDSGDAIRHLDGRPAEGPIALAEVQGYAYAARRSMARLARHRGETELAARIDSDADALRERFDTAFWMPDAGFYAMALDGQKRAVASIGSNAGQALWAGIVAPERAARVAERLLAPDMFSGWGIRTFAAGQAGYNPVGYHTGSIWPHDNALIAAGLKATGTADGANLVAGRLIEAAQWFPDLRLPELFCGFAREDVGAPVAYPVACSPQAWSAAAPYYLIQTMLGLRADATAGRLELLHPTLPDWLGKLTISGLSIGAGSVDLLVHRWRGTTSAEVVGRRGAIDVIIHA